MIDRDSIFGLGILAYVGLWACVLWLTTKIAKKNINLRRAERMSSSPKIALLYGWMVIVVVFVLARNILPEVSVITKDIAGASAYHERHYMRFEPDSIEQNWDYAHAFYYKSGFVPFYYDGHFCRAGAKYVYNTSGDTLEIYSVTYLNGIFSSCPQEPVQVIPPGRFMPLEVKIADQFNIPTEYISHLPEDHKDKSVTEYYIDLSKRAQSHREDIRKKMVKRMSIIFPE